MNNLPKFVRTIKFSSRVSSIYLSNVAKANTSLNGYNDTKLLTHYQFSKNGVGYFKTKMEHNMIHKFLENHKFLRNHYEIIEKDINTMHIYLGKYD